jgi:hypothetical protein
LESPSGSHWRRRLMIDDHSSAMPGAPAEESLFGDVTTLI